MPSFDDLNTLINALSNNGHNLNSQQKQDLVNLLKAALEVEGKQSIEEVLAALREEIKNILKTDDAIKTSAIDALGNEIKQKVSNFEQLEKEKLELQDQLTSLQNAAKELEAAKQQAEDKQKELQDQLNTAKQGLEAAKKAAEQEKATLQTQLAQVEEKDKQINTLNAQVADLQQQLEAKGQEIAQLKQQPSNAEVEKLKKDLAAKNTEVQQLQKQNKELEAKKQPTEQPKQSNGAQYTAAAGFGLAAGLAAFIALERTVRLDIWTMVGIAVASALLVSGATYLALKPSTQMNEAGTQKVNGEVPAKS